METIYDITAIILLGISCFLMLYKLQELNDNAAMSNICAFVLIMTSFTFFLMANNQKENNYLKEILFHKERFGTIITNKTRNEVVISSDTIVFHK